MHKSIRVKRGRINFVICYSNAMSEQTYTTADSTAEGRAMNHLPVYVQCATLLANYSIEEKSAFVAGLKMYQDHPFRRDHTARYEDIIWQAGQASVQYYPAKSGDAEAALFIVPSMINKSYILDLLPAQSFISWLTAHGMDVYLFDWGQPCEDESMQCVDDVLEKILLRAVHDIFAQQNRNKRSKRVYALGYCMGGTLLAGLLQHCAGLFRGNVFLAAPWDFHAGDMVLNNAIQAGTPSGLQMIEAEKRLPSNWIENVFASAQAEKSIRKYIEFSRTDQQSEKARLFVAVEDWLHDGLDLPGALAKTCLLDWYRDNKTVLGQWKSGAKAVDLSAIDTASLVVASENDKLVPARSSLAMAEHLPVCDIMQPPCGHIGMMTSKHAGDSLWKPMLDWISGKS